MSATTRAAVLDEIADDIRRLDAQALAAERAALDAQLAIGHRLIEARRLLARDVDYGRWFRAANFGFTTQWARVLREAARREAGVRQVVASQLATTGRANLEDALARVTDQKVAPVRYRRLRGARAAPDWGAQAQDATEMLRGCLNAWGVAWQPTPKDVRELQRIVDLAAEKGITATPDGRRSPAMGASPTPLELPVELDWPASAWDTGEEDGA